MKTTKKFSPKKIFFCLHYAKKTLKYILHVDYYSNPYYVKLELFKSVFFRLPRKKNSLNYLQKVFNKISGMQVFVAVVILQFFCTRKQLICRQVHAFVAVLFN